MSISTHAQIYLFNFFFVCEDCYRYKCKGRYFSVGLCHSSTGHTQALMKHVNYSCKYFGRDPVFSGSRKEIENIRGTQYSYQSFCVSVSHIFLYKVIFKYRDSSM